MTWTLDRACNKRRRTRRVHKKLVVIYIPNVYKHLYDTFEYCIIFVSKRIGDVTPRIYN